LLLPKTKKKLINFKKQNENFMQNVIKSTFLFTIFLLVIDNKINAQDKYEFGVVMYTSKGNNNATEYRIIESISENFKIVNEGKLSEGTYFTNFTPVNKELEKLATEGWEIYNSHYNSTSVYFIRRKKGN